MMNLLKITLLTFLLTQGLTAQSDTVIPHKFESVPYHVPDIEVVIATADSMIPILQKHYLIPGVSCVIIKNNYIAWSKSFGVTDVRTGEPVTDKTMFEACSMTKPVFAYIAMKLVEEGKLKLDEPIWTIFDDPAFQGQEWRKKITPRMLLSHTSGLPNWRPGEDEENGYLPIEFEPGTKFQYSGEGIYLLQKVVEKITGTSLDELAQETIFSQFFMMNSSFIWTPEYDSRIASGHDTSGNFIRKTNYSRANAGYTLYCSAEDYARFLLDVMSPIRPGDASLAAETIDTMLARQVESPSREPQKRPGGKNGIKTFRSLGWAIDQTPTGDIHYHSGSNGSGFKCYHQFDRKTGSGIIIMTNSLGGLGLWDALIQRLGDL